MWSSSIYTDHKEIPKRTREGGNANTAFWVGANWMERERERERERKYNSPNRQKKEALLGERRTLRHTSQVTETHSWFHISSTLVLPWSPWWIAPQSEQKCYIPLSKTVNSNLDRESSLPVYVPLLPRLSALRATWLVLAQWKQEMSYLNLNSSFQACFTHYHGKYDLFK